MDAFAVKQPCKFAKEHALKNGPIERDPIERIRNLIYAHNLATEKDLKDIQKQMRKEVDDAIAVAKVTNPSKLIFFIFNHGMQGKVLDLMAWMVETLAGIPSNVWWARIKWVFTFSPDDWQTMCGQKGNSKS